MFKSYDSHHLDSGKKRRTNETMARRRRKVRKTNVKNESATYSPSPWRVVRTNTDLYIYSAYSKAEKKRFPYSNGRVIAKVADYSAYSKEKNARLIAAAPELLTAAKLTLAYLRRKRPAPSDSVENQLMNILEKVVAKAEFEEEEKR